MKQTRPWLLSLAFILSATCFGGCGRQHLSSTYAQSYTAWFAAQHARTKPANSAETKRTLESLDAAEAAAVSKNYRKARGSDEAGGSRMLMIGPSRAGEQTYLPATSSVPQ